MSPALLSLLALVAAIVLSIATRLNVGIIALALAWLVGVYGAGLKPDAVLAEFPSSLFITLAGVTLLFAIAEVNGTLERFTARLLGLARGNAYALPLLFFGIACLISSVGPGAISSVALVAPIAMATAARAGAPAFLTALMVANGANAGNLSPISSVGVIANTKMAEAGLPNEAFKVWFANFAAHLVVATVAYFVLRRRGVHVAAQLASPAPLERVHRWSALLIAGWIAGVVVFKLNLGLSAFAVAALLLVTRSGDDGAALRKMPWGVIVMVCGVSVLIGVLEASGGMELFATLLSRLASPGSVNGVIAFVTGTISTYSSTSGVVLPAFLPTAPGIAERVGGDPLAIALSINVGSSLVDVSPLSTLGALCLAALPEREGADRLFRQLLLWGVSMTVVGALLCLLLAGPLARA